MSRLTLWPMFAALVMIVLYQKRSESITEEWISYSAFVAGATFAFIWAADILKPGRLLAAIFGLACCATLYAATLSDKLTVAFLSGGITFSVGVVIWFGRRHLFATKDR